MSRPLDPHVRDELVKYTRKRKKSHGEESLAWQIRHALLSDFPAPERERRVTAGRRWRFDFAWPDYMLAVEVDGGTRSGGRHVRGDGFERDCEKLNMAAIDGWTVLRFTTRHVANGYALKTIRQALENIDLEARRPVASVP